MDHQFRRADTAKINKPGTEAHQACLLFFMLKKMPQAIRSIAASEEYACLRGRQSRFYFLLSCIPFSLTNFSRTLKSSITFLNGKDPSTLSR